MHCQIHHLMSIATCCCTTVVEWHAPAHTEGDLHCLVPEELPRLLNSQIRFLEPDKSTRWLQYLSSVAEIQHQQRYRGRETNFAMQNLEDHTHVAEAHPEAAACTNPSSTSDATDGGGGPRSRGGVHPAGPGGMVQPHTLFATGMSLEQFFDWVLWFTISRCSPSIDGNLDST